MQINSEIKMVIGIVIVCVLLLGAFVWFGPKSLVVERDLSVLVRSDSQMTGKIDAKVTLVEFADFQCPACGQVAPYIKQIIDEHKANPNFNFVFRNFPLDQHANAMISGEAALSAGAQGKYVEMAEMLYANQDHWSEVKNPTDIFVGYATALGLDAVKFKADLDSGKFKDIMTRDLRDAMALALNHTPTFFLNGEEVLDLRNLKADVAAALTK